MIRVGWRQGEEKGRRWRVEEERRGKKKSANIKAR